MRENLLYRLSPNNRVPLCRLLTYLLTLDINNNNKGGKSLAHFRHKSGLGLVRLCSVEIAALAW